MNEKMRGGIIFKLLRKVLSQFWEMSLVGSVFMGVFVLYSWSLLEFVVGYGSCRSLLGLCSV